jgi:hypothetical protein
MDLRWRSLPPAISKNKNKRDRINRGCNRSLNVFQVTSRLHYNNGIYKQKWGAASYLYILGTVLSDCDILFNFTNWPCP